MAGRRGTGVAGSRSPGVGHDGRSFRSMPDSAGCPGSAGQFSLFRLSLRQFQSVLHHGSPYPAKREIKSSNGDGSLEIPLQSPTGRESAPLGHWPRSCPCGCFQHNSSTPAGDFLGQRWACPRGSGAAPDPPGSDGSGNHLALFWPRWHNYSSHGSLWWPPRRVSL